MFPLILPATEIVPASFKNESDTSGFEVVTAIDGFEVVTAIAAFEKITCPSILAPSI
jgi:hypothetical protein